MGFNTVNGKCCCNDVRDAIKERNAKSFNTVNGKCCCNSLEHRELAIEIYDVFQYRKR